MSQAYGACGAGARDRAVLVQQAPSVTAKGSSGMPVETWTSLVSLWMKQSDVRAAERFASGQMTAQYDTMWELPYRVDMDPELVDVPKCRRLVYAGRVFDIVDATQIGRRQGITLKTITTSKVPQP